MTGTGLEVDQYIVAEDGLFADSIDFLDVYFGKITKQKYYILNNAPDPVDFKTHIITGNYFYLNNSRKY